jgi:hypothetical protein
MNSEDVREIALDLIERSNAPTPHCENITILDTVAVLVVESMIERGRDG